MHKKVWIFIYNANDNIVSGVVEQESGVSPRAAMLQWLKYRGEPASRAKSYIVREGTIITMKEIRESNKA